LNNIESKNSGNINAHGTAHKDPPQPVGLDNLAMGGGEKGEGNREKKGTGTISRGTKSLLGSVEVAASELKKQAL